MTRLFAAVTALAAALCSGQEMRSGSEKKNPLAGQKPAIEAGAKRFKEGCAACHGANAEGGRGPKLVRNRDLYRLTDEQIFDILRRGIPGTSMPPSQMPDQQTWELVSFVRSLNSPASQAVITGNPENGKTLFYGDGHCSTCHSIRGHGGLIGPDLTDAGATLTVSELRESMEHPSAEITPGFETVSIKLKDGTEIEGVAKNYSNYSIDILDRKGELHLLDKANVATITWNKQSLMPADIAKSLVPGGIDDVIAFLAQQVVRPPGAAERGRRRRQDIE
ncbi:MAG: c-type cytochrome [Acidobacteriaceae bacterium]|nr:c-type cytochrome [Acidobacteriaceae bacterium]